MISPFDHGAVGDGVADDTAALQSAVNAMAATGEEINLGGHLINYRTTAPVILHATEQGFRRGLRMVGEARITPDYNGDLNDAVIKMDSTALYRFRTNVKLEGFRIEQPIGRTGLHAIRLEATWFVEISDLILWGMSGSGISCIFRPDLHPTISDGYQAFAVEVKRTRFESCGRYGMEFAGGQSPGLYVAQHNIVHGNKLGGIFSSTGQCRIEQNQINENGSNGSGGGIVFDTVEGMQYNPRIISNELDGNFGQHLKFLRTRSATVEDNRFLSQTYDSPTGWIVTSGTPYIRPGIHVQLGDGVKEAWNCFFHKNYHRSVVPPNQTTAPVVGYQGSASCSAPRIWYPDWGLRDGFNQNSTNFVPYQGMPGNASILEVGAPPPSPPPPVDPDLVVRARATSATGQDVYNTITHLDWPVVDQNDGGMWSTLTFTPAETRPYNFRASRRFANMAAGDTVQWSVGPPGSPSYEPAITATGSSSQDFAMDKTVSCVAGATYKVAMKLGAGIASRQMNASDPTKNWLEVRRL